MQEAYAAAVSNPEGERTLEGLARLLPAMAAKRLNGAILALPLAGTVTVTRGGRCAHDLLLFDSVVNSVLFDTAVIPVCLGWTFVTRQAHSDLQRGGGYALMRGDGCTPGFRWSHGAGAVLLYTTA